MNKKQREVLEALQKAIWCISHEASDRPRYMISVAAELVGMHRQTLRMYEQKGS